MKKIIFVIIAVCCVTSVYSQQQKKSKKGKNEVIVAPKTDIEIISYALGSNLSDGLKQNAEQHGITIDWDWVLRGIQESVNGTKQFDEEKMKNAFAKLDSMVRENNKQKAKRQKDFLEENKKKPGIITSPSGLQYEIIKLGTGPKPTEQDKVVVQYEGKTIDGKVFDSSYQRGEPITFPLSNVIKGWIEGLQMMPVGSKFKFYIPSELAYGEQGAAGMIEPYSTLIFEVELLDINPSDNQKYEQPKIKF